MSDLFQLPFMGSLLRIRTNFKQQHLSTKCWYKSTTEEQRQNRILFPSNPLFCFAGFTAGSPCWCIAGPPASPPSVGRSGLLPAHWGLSSIGWSRLPPNPRVQLSLSLGPGPSSRRLLFLLFLCPLGGLLFMPQESFFCNPV